ncbi:hypothetical protein ACIBI0_29665 [Microbispora rosea]|uniref:hypothetical protein n=1 Tax=Microbispora rosea TaxID=58117 RepID=UPI0037914615
MPTLPTMQDPVTRPGWLVDEDCWREERSSSPAVRLPPRGSLMSFDPAGYLLRPNDGPPVWFLDTRMNVKAGAEQTGKRHEQRDPPPWHR